MAPCAQIGVNLGKSGYLAEVQQKTADIDVQIVFCNAGYMLTGFFDSMCASAGPLAWGPGLITGMKSRRWCIRGRCSQRM